MTHISVFGGFLCVWISYFRSFLVVCVVFHSRRSQEKLSNSVTQQCAYHYTGNDYSASLHCSLPSVGLMEGSKSAEKISQRKLLASSKKGLGRALGVMHLSMGAAFLVGRKQVESGVMLH